MDGFVARFGLLTLISEFSLVKTPSCKRLRSAYPRSLHRLLINATEGHNMGLRFLEHLLILTHDAEGTRDWFCKNLGFRNGDHPDFGFPVYWLYIGEQDVIHIGKAQHSEHQDNYLKTPTEKAVLGSIRADATGSGRIDHVCFNCDGMQEFVERLTRNGVEFSERKAHNAKLYQLFMREPVNGIKVELNFSWEEAARMGRVPAYTDAGNTGKLSS
jgi:catechol 2,3-dioxygenase-like lactoylglutathione lyase family enzyme